YEVSTDWSSDVCSSDLRLEPPGLPKGPLMEGVRYGLNQWPTLVRFLEDGRIREVSNSGCERALRAVVVGRKNWLFFGSEEGTDGIGRASCRGRDGEAGS